jgi:hypothetical protein
MYIIYKYFVFLAILKSSKSKKVRSKKISFLAPSALPSHIACSKQTGRLLEARGPSARSKRGVAELIAKLGRKLGFKKVGFWGINLERAYFFTTFVTAKKMLSAQHWTGRERTKLTN